MEPVPIFQLRLRYAANTTGHRPPDGPDNNVLRGREHDVPIAALSEGQLYSSCANANVPIKIIQL